MPLDLEEMINSGMSFPAIASELSRTWSGPKVKPKDMAWPFIKDGDQGRMSDLICARDAAIKRLDWLSRSSDAELQAEIMERHQFDVERFNREQVEREARHAKRTAILEELDKWAPSTDLLKDYKYHLSRMMEDEVEDETFDLWQDCPAPMLAGEYRKREACYIALRIAATEQGIKALAAHLKRHRAWQAELHESLGISVPSTETSEGDNGNA